MVVVVVVVVMVVVVVAAAVAINMPHFSVFDLLPCSALQMPASI